MTAQTEKSSVSIPYGKQCTPEETLDLYCRWLLSQEYLPEDREKFLYCGEKTYEWYMIFYALRTLSLGAALLNRPEYAETAEYYFDIYCDEQLPDGALTSNYRGRKGSQMSQKEIEILLKTGKLNLADNGSNCQALVQAAMLTRDAGRREKYLGTVRKWLDQWVPIWALSDGSYGNGIWLGNKNNTTYSCAVNVCSALASYAVVSGDSRYAENAEGFASFICDHTLPDGRPIFFNVYPRPRLFILDDYSHMFYTLEGLCWTHYASRNEVIRKKIEHFLRKWLFSDYGILKCWPKKYNWFNSNYISFWNGKDEDGGELESFGMWACPGWKNAKANGIPHLFSYYLNHIEENAEIRDRFERGVQYLCRPLDATVNGVLANPREHYGQYAVQSTGFAGLTIAEAIRSDFVFHAVGTP